MTICVASYYFQAVKQKTNEIGAPSLMANIVFEARRTTIILKNSDSILKFFA